MTEPTVTLFSWWGILGLSPEAAACLLVVGWSSAPLWAHQLVVRAGRLKPWYPRRPMVRHSRSSKPGAWVPEVAR